MSDIVVTLPMRDADERDAFSDYLHAFVRGRVAEADRFARRVGAPYLMVRGDTTLDGELRVVVFQLKRVARAFVEGWDRLCAEADRRG